jgi:hypothetical protein
MFRGKFSLDQHRAKSSQKWRCSIARAKNMTAPQGSLPQSNQGEVAMNAAFSPAWEMRA